MGPLQIRPGDRLIKNYYESLHQFGQLEFDHEGAVRSAFQALLDGYGKRLEWKLVPEYPYKKVRVDGALLDTWKQRRGFWEAKDVNDDLEKEIRSKIERGYPTTNIIFQAPERAILYQRGMRVGLNENIGDAKNLVELLKEFFSYKEPEHEEWDKAVDDFSERLPEIAKRAKDLIDHERVSNKAFRDRFEEFYALCRRSINPNLSFEAVEEMLIQHLLTERIFRRVFHAEEFRTRNVIAQEIEKVISSLTSRHFSRDAFLSELDRFYKAIERSAEEKSDYAEKQDFLNTVYERFFQGYSPKEADTHGIVYTPQPIVDFMVRSVEDILKKEFGKSLSDKGVHILDPFVGTGNFIVRIMREMKKSALPYKYENELHCNEVMLLPYYIASMNIEHEYFEQTGEYRAFPGICLVDTFDMHAQSQLLSERNTARIELEQQAKIFVALGNPPYNAWQLNENDNNKNRKYEHLDRRIRETYSKSSRATNRNALLDPYVKAIRWASDRIGDEGLIAFVTNNAFVDSFAADGMRKHLAAEFDEVYVLDLGGNVRKNPKLSGTTHNVFGIQIGVSINLFVRHNIAREKRTCKIRYARVDEFWTKEQKFEWLDIHNRRDLVEWQDIVPDDNSTWLTGGLHAEFDRLTRLTPQIFAAYSCGIKTNRDVWTYNFDRAELVANVARSTQFYNEEVSRFEESEPRSENVDSFVRYDEKRIAWSRDLKADLKRGRKIKADEHQFRMSLYRPFTKQWLFFDRVFNEEVYSLSGIFPLATSENTAIVCTDVAYRSGYSVLATNTIPNIHLAAAADTFQCFPFYTYDEDGSNRRENITDWALNEFRTHYKDQKIGKWDIFHYVYGVLHSPEYRERYAANLKRELPRIPFASAATNRSGRPSEGSRHAPSLHSSPSPTASNTEESGRIYAKLSPEQIKNVLEQVRVSQDAGELRYVSRADEYVFWAFANAGKRLADLHVNYEKQPEYRLERIENPKEKLNLRVEKMRLNKDKSLLIYNSFLTLKGIPPETYEYRLGNRSALEWIVDQYRVSTDKRSGITNDPNREDDPEYILRLIGQVVYVSLETVKIVRALPKLGVKESASATSAH